MCNQLTSLPFKGLHSVRSVITRSTEEDGIIQVS